MYLSELQVENFEEKVPGKVGECCLTLKNTRASRALRRALDPGQCMLALLRAVSKSRQIIAGPPHQILDPHLVKVKVIHTYIAHTCDNHVICA